MFKKEYDVITKKISKISQYDITENHIVKKSYSEDKLFLVELIIPLILLQKMSTITIFLTPKTFMSIILELLKEI